MSHLIEWDNEEKTVLLQQYLEGATKDDLYLLAKKSAEMLATVSHTVHLIIDERNINLILNAADMKYLEKNVPANQGEVVLISPGGSDAYKKMVNQIAQQTAPRAFTELMFASNLEEAREILKDTFGVLY